MLSSSTVRTVLAKPFMSALFFASGVTYDTLTLTRIDRLQEREKELLQTASVIGYQVSEPLLRAISGLPDGELSDALYSLVTAELLSERMGEAGVEYAF